MVTSDDEGTMVPLGWDTILWSTTPPARVLHQTLIALSAMWPSMRGSIEPPNRAFTIASIPSEDEFDPEENTIFVVRDEAMDRHFDDEGQVPMADGEGPLSFFSSRQVGPLVDVTVHDDADGDWNTRIACPSLYQYTVVTPADPKSDPFSKKIFELLTRACLAAGESAPVDSTA